MSGRKIRVRAIAWHLIPWHRDCDACVHFVAAPAHEQGQAYLLQAVWNHFYIDHHTMLTGDERLGN